MSDQWQGFALADSVSHYSLVDGLPVDASWWIASSWLEWCQDEIDINVTSCKMIESRERSTLSQVWEWIRSKGIKFSKLLRKLSQLGFQIETRNGQPVHLIRCKLCPISAEKLNQHIFTLNFPGNSINLIEAWSSRAADSKEQLSLFVLNSSRGFYKRI